MRFRSSLWRRVLVIGIAALILATFGTQITFAQDAEVAAPSAEDFLNLSIAIDTGWVMLTAFLVFFMQAGFAMLETGLVRQTSAVNALSVNFVDATITGFVFWLVGFGIAFGADNGSGLFGTSMFAVGIGEMGQVPFAFNIPILVFFVFQFAFAATAATITTGALAERTDFFGDQAKSVIIGALIYPVVVHWIWGGGWIAQRGFYDFAGSTVVHFVGGFAALIGAIIMGPRPGRVWGKPPRPHNLALATLGTMILWFGWYGFNPGSTLGVVGQHDLVGLVSLNTTLAACAGTFGTAIFVFLRTKKWDLAYSLNGSLAGLVGITAGCAFVGPVFAVVIGLAAGVIVVLAMDVIESLKIDDAVGAFAVHGVCGVFGTLAIGLFGAPELMGGNAGLFTGGGATVLVNQAIGVVGVALWVGVTSTLMFLGLKAVGRLRVNKKADEIGIDIYEHGTTVWPDILPVPGDEAPVPGTTAATAPAVGD